MYESVQIVLALGPIAVGLAALAQAARRQTQGFRHEREMADLAYMRTVIDEAAIALHEADYARADVVQGFMMHGTNLKEKRPGAGPKLTETGVGLDALRARLGVLRGDADAMVEAFERADEALLVISRAIQFLNLDDDDPRRAKLNDERREKMKQASEDFAEGWADFRVAATAAVGAQIPS